MNKEKSAEENRQIEWVKQAQQKDVDAFTKLYEQFSKELYQSACYYLHNQQDAEDAVSETVMAAWTQLATLREPEKFRAWLFKILSNRCKSKQRQYLEKPLELREDFSELPEERVSDVAGRLDLRAAFRKLVEADRMILILSVLEGYTTKEVANMLDMNHATVRSRKSRALERLAELLT